jgi:caa(3)-type oxidase subunit IV
VAWGPLEVFAMTSDKAHAAEVALERAHPSYVGIWVWLVLLMVAGVLASRLPLAHSAVVTLIFAIAAVKAGLVALYYMGLRFERGVIYAMALVPLALVVILTFLLLPDFVFHHH